MAQIQISEAEVIANFSILLARARAGEEFLITREDGRNVVMKRLDEAEKSRTLSESLRLLEERGSNARLEGNQVPDHRRRIETI